VKLRSPVSSMAGYDRCESNVRILPGPAGMAGNTARRAVSQPHLIGAQREHCAGCRLRSHRPRDRYPFAGLTFFLDSTSTKLQSPKRERATAQLLRKTVEPLALIERRISAQRWLVQQ